MKLKSILIPATLALASLASSASAANVTATFGDVILGFRSTNASFTNNLEVNLGSVDTFSRAAAGTSFAVANLNVADLVTAYGASWFTSTTSFGLIGTTGKTGGGAVGTDGQPLSTVYVSNDVSTYASLNSSTNNNAVTKALLLYTGALGSLSNNAATANSSSSAIIAGSTVGSFSNAGGTSGNAFANYARTSFESTLGTGTSVSTSLYELLPTNGGVDEATLTPTNGVAAGVFQGVVGTFSLADTGVLTFTSNGLHSAIPEPSTYAALAGAAVLGLAAYRRRPAARV